MTPKAWWQRRTGCAKALLAETFASSMGTLEGVEPRLAAALGDILTHPGSLVRAVTAYQMGIQMGVAERAGRSVACGIEYLHTASLVIDDLPAMDDARMRRGIACPHVTHGEGIAMLAALALVNRGYAMLWQGIRKASPARRERAGEWVDARLGTGGVIGGQAFDLSGWRGERSVTEVSKVAASKTADLLRLTLVLPAIIGRGTDEEIRSLDRIGLFRGLAYQAADDLKDVLCSPEESGKTGGRDAELGRPNLILTEGFQATLHRFRRLRRIGDRVQDSLPGGKERWGMLAPLRVTLPSPPHVISVAV